MREFGITVETAVTGELRPGVSLPGEVVLNADGVAHVTPRVPGIARRVFRGVGDHVQRGDVLAELDSRALAEAKGAYLAALARITLAQTNLNREQRLYDSQISSERTYLEAQQALQEATIALQLAEQNLHALGVGHDELEQLTDEPDVDYTRYELTAPLSGVIIERHLVPGEVVTGEPGDPPYVVADLSTVWVNLTVYQKDLGVVRAGQPVRITFGHGIPDATGAIAFVSPVIDEATRTATARVVLDNLHGQWRPGLFVTGHLTLEQASAVVIVPRSALQTVEDEAVVFVQTEAGFEPRHVETGRVDDTHVEIIKGLAPGDRYVAANAFALKAELNRAALEHAGHAH